jgi:NAD(P)H dehydrogenase (quinone)
MKNILVINGHPRKDSFSSLICETYKKAAEDNQAKVDILDIIDLKFEAFQTVFRDYQAPEDILKARGLIKEADHIVWVYPIWWYSMPALLKAFIEQSIMSGFAFKYLESDKNLKWDKYLKGKTTSVISTMDAPGWYYRFIVGNPGGKVMKASMGFCGIQYKHSMYFGPMVLSTETQREKWIAKIKAFGYRHK